MLNSVVAIGRLVHYLKLGTRPTAALAGPRSPWSLIGLVRVGEQSVGPEDPITALLFKRRLPCPGKSFGFTQATGLVLPRSKFVSFGGLSGQGQLLFLRVLSRKKGEPA